MAGPFTTNSYTLTFPRTCLDATPTPRLRSSMQALPEPRRHSRTPKHLPADLTKYVLNLFSTKTPPFYVTLDDIAPPLERLEVDQITVHQSSRPGRCHRCHVRNSMGRTPQPFLGARTGPTALPPPHHSLGQAPLRSTARQPLIPPDEHPGRTPRTVAVPGRSRPRFRVQPRSTHPLASPLQLFYSSCRRRPLVQGPPWPLVVWQNRSSHLNRQLINRLLHRLLPRRPGADQDRLPTVVLHHFTKRSPTILVSSASSGRRTGSRIAMKCWWTLWTPPPPPLTT